MMKNYIELYDEVESVLCGNSAEVLNGVRRGGRDWLSRCGFPTTKDESYLNSAFALNGGKNAILENDYGVNVNRLRFPINPERIFKCAVPGIHAHVLFMINDMLYSEPKIDMGGAVFCSLKMACEVYRDVVERVFGGCIVEDAYVALNAMFAQDGYFLYVPKGVKVELPIQLINIMRADVDSMASGRNLIVVEEGAEAHLLVCDHVTDERNFLANRQTEVFVGVGAKLHYYSVESTHAGMNNLSGVYVNQEGGSRFVYSTLGLVNGNTRNSVVVNLNGEGAEVTLGGMLVSDRMQHTDNHTVINHNAAHCRSTELYKYILDEEAQAVFSALVNVRKGAQRTVAQQTNRNILLTSTARVWSRPQLIIDADDVKCGHGATTGQLDERAMFYMQQRGIGRNEARMLLLSAFAADVIALVEIEALRERLTLMIERRLRGEASKCAGCSC